MIGNVLSIASSGLAEDDDNDDDGDADNSGNDIDDDDGLPPTARKSLSSISAKTNIDEIPKAEHASL